MSTYTIEQICEDGPQYAMAMLIECIKSGEPFVTYGAIASELEYQLKINKIFSTHMGYVAGTLMDSILEIDPKAPLINVLITRPTGIPGVGAGGYLAKRYKSPKLLKWDKVPLSKKKEIIERERKKVFKYKKWEEIYKELFGGSSVKLRTETGTEYDFSTSSNYGGAAESDEHKKLKEWVSLNPHKIGVSKTFGVGITESRLLSGDEVDVVFSDGNSFKVIEVKSCRSNNEDFKRGVYQCVKYREVKKAEHAPYDIDVQSILVTERELNPELQERAKLLGIKWKMVSVNK
ncbi:MAG: hypothetical protein OEW87_04735 [Flavobacteriaceae bacterium]|nr:hypothetical protein [Flavobacteriaceae bacterium]